MRITIGLVAALAGFHEIGVLHVARRVTDGEVEQLEVELVRLHLAGAVHLESHLAEDAEQLAQHLRVRVQPPVLHGRPGRVTSSDLAGKGAGQCRILDELICLSSVRLRGLLSPCWRHCPTSGR